MSPYTALNILENIKHHDYNEEPELDRFDMMMDTLWGVVENYLKKWTPLDEEELKKSENIEKYKKDQNSIDLNQ